MRIFSSFMTCFVVVAVCKVHFEFEIEKVQSIVLNDEKKYKQKKINKPKISQKGGKEFIDCIIQNF